jgi:hypothetical protein
MKSIILSFLLALSAFAQQTQQARVVICADAGSTDDYACAPTPSVASYASGLRVRMYANTANTGAATLDLDGGGALTAKTIKKLGGGITTDLATNDIRAGQYVDLIYDGTNFQMLSQLGNAAAAGGGSYTLQGYGGGNSVAQATTTTFTFTGYAGTLADSSGDVRIPFAATIRNLAVKISSTQPSAQTLTCTVAKIPAASAWNATPTATAVTLTIATSAAANWYTSGATSEVLGAGDRVVLQCAQQAGASGSGAVRTFSLEVAQ